MAVEGGLAPPVLSALAPSGLAVGDSFRLLFATSGARDAATADIDDYNGFVQSEAAAGHADIQAYSSLFTVVASTEDTDARDNTRTTYADDEGGVPIYWLGGSKVADDYQDFYDGDWDDEANPKDQSGNSRSLTGSANYPFTGSGHDGTEAIFDHSLSYALGSTQSQVRVGKPNDGGTGSGPLSSMTNSGYLDPHPFYALSPVFVVGLASVSRNWSLAPTGLEDGDSFRLLFATHDVRPAAATDIADYNTFVQTAAANGHLDIRDYSALFAVVGSTANVDARTTRPPAIRTTTRAFPSTGWAATRSPTTTRTSTTGRGTTRRAPRTRSAPPAS